MKSFLGVSSPVCARSQVIEKEITQELIEYAKSVLPKIDNVLERERELLLIADEGVVGFQKE